MRAARAFWAVGAVFACLLFAPHAFAQKILLLRPPAEDELLSEAFNRLRAELALQGFEPSISAPTPDSTSPRELALLAKREGAFAGISLTRRADAPAADVCIADRVTGKIVLRSLALGKEPDAANVIAIRTVGLLRASLHEFGEGQEPPPDVIDVDQAAAASSAVERWAHEPTPAPSFRVDLRAALVGVGQDIGLGYAPSLALGYRAFERVGFGALLAGPALGASYQSANGTASVRQELALARVEVIAFESERLYLRPSIAAGVYHLAARGEVNPPLAAQSDQVTSFAGGLGFDADLRLGQRLLLGAGLAALLLTPRPAVAVFDQQYTFAWPFMMATLGLGIEL